MQACSQPIGYVTNNLDCDDSNPAVHPGAVEICNGIDDNCNGLIDENLTEDCSLMNECGVATCSAGQWTGCTPMNTYYQDLDGDGYGNLFVSMQACSQPIGYVNNSLDCNDNNSNIHPGAPELCNGIDDNCNGLIDENLTENCSLLGACGMATCGAGSWTGCAPMQVFYYDADGDGFGNATNNVTACSPPPHFVPIDSDCNDNNASMHPGAPETCNGVNTNCAGIDLNCSSVCDQDGDGYWSSQGICGVLCPIAALTNPNVQCGDCNDNNSAVHPGANETCNGIDDNCNGYIDEGLTRACAANQCGISTCNAGNWTGCTPMMTYYQDHDGDGYGNPAVSVQACSQPIGYVTNNQDCNDNNSAVHPGAPELCNGIDDNCNGVVDENLSESCSVLGMCGVASCVKGNWTGCTPMNTYYQDLDGDGLGDAHNWTMACSQPIGYVNNSNDACPTAKGYAMPKEMTINITSFSSTLGATKRVYVSNTQVNISSDGLYHIPLTDANGNDITDHTDFSKLPTGIIEVDRNGMSRVNVVVWGQYSQSSGYTYYKFTVNASGYYYIRNEGDHGIPYKTPNGNAVVGDVNHDSCQQSGSQVHAECSVRTSSDSFTMYFFDFDGCPYGVRMLSQAQITCDLKAAICNNSLSCVLPTLNSTAKVFYTDDLMPDIHEPHRDRQEPAALYSAQPALLEAVLF